MSLVVEDCNPVRIYFWKKPFHLDINIGKNAAVDEII